MKPQTCTLLFLIRDKEILLALKKRGFGEGLWNGAGGKVEADELLEQALVRECQEEIGVTPTEYTKVAVHEFVYETDNRVMIVHAYLCTKWLGEPMESEEMLPQWFKQSEIPYEKMWADDIHWLPKALESKKLHTKFTFNAAEELIDGKIHEAEHLEHHG